MHNTFQMHHPSNTVYDPTLRVHDIHPVYGYQQMMPVYQPIQRKEIQIQLKNQDQWKYLHESKGGNEMLLNINGKPLFPKIQCDVQNLDASKDYDIGIKMVRCNPKQFVHDKNAGKWIPDEKSDVVPDKESNEVFIRESGAYLMGRGIDFGNVKIYNDKILKSNEIPSVPKNLKKEISCKVNIRCLYIPVMTIYENDRNTIVHRFQFEETQFMAVTEYKNKVVKQFKIHNNKSVPGRYRKAPAVSEQGEKSEEAPSKRNRKRAAKVPVTDSKKFKGSPDASTGSPVNSMASTYSRPIQNASGSPNGSHSLDSTNSSISSNVPRSSMYPLTAEKMPPSTSSGAAKNYFEYGYDFSSTSSSSPESLNRFSTSPPMTFDENQDPMVNYSNLMAPSTSNAKYSNPMDTNSFGNECNNFYPTDFDFNAAPNPYPFDFNNDYKL
ncbi:unnamed protein product [Caenorhabditis nigoni]